MKKILTASLLGLSLLSFFAATRFSQNAQNILNRMIDATGGRKTLEGIKDTTFSGTMELVQYGMSATITFYHKEPNKFRQDLELTGLGTVMTSGYNGNVAWRINLQTGSVEDIPGSAGEEFKNQAVNRGFSWMLRPEKYGISYTDKGKETIDGKDYLVLEQTAPGDLSTTYYIDPETYLVYKTKGMTTDPRFQVEQESIVEDYRKVDGIMFAHTVIIYKDGKETASMNVDALKFNSGLEDSLFNVNAQEENEKSTNTIPEEFKIVIDGRLFNKDKFPLIDKEVFLYELGLVNDKAMVLLKWDEEKCVGPRALTDSSGNFKFELDKRTLKEKNVFALGTPFDLKEEQIGLMNARLSVDELPEIFFLDPKRKPITVAVEKETKSKNLGDIIILE